MERCRKQRFWFFYSVKKLHLIFWISWTQSTKNLTLDFKSGWFRLFNDILFIFEFCHCCRCQNSQGTDLLFLQFFKKTKNEPIFCSAHLMALIHRFRIIYCSCVPNYGFLCYLQMYGENLLQKCVRICISMPIFSIRVTLFYWNQLIMALKWTQKLQVLK